MTLTRLLSLRVDFRDEAAGAAITPEQANAYLTARGWYRGDVEHWSIWSRADCEYPLMVPRETRWDDYGRRMVEFINNLAAHENRSPLAVWADLAGLT
jgi:hypothetical protein